MSASAFHCVHAGLAWKWTGFKERLRAEAFLMSYAGEPWLAISEMQRLALVQEENGLSGLTWLSF